MTEPSSHLRTSRGRGNVLNDIGLGGRQTHSRNKQWVAGESGMRSGSITPHNDGERWERGGHRGGRGARGATRGGRGKFSNVSIRTPRDRDDATSNSHEHRAEEQHMGEEVTEIEDDQLESLEEREKFYQELVKAREVERKKAIAEGKMDDPAVPKRLEDAISVVGTCLDMCPRFERYRRERENNLFEWETIPGTKRVDHKRAVKMYERAAGDKTLPSDLRPPHVLKRTLDYLFHDLLPRGGFSQTYNFIRDRSRAVRNDFTMQNDHGPVAIECHDRCARFHTLALHLERDNPAFSVALEEQQLMNTLQSLKEFYEDQRDRYESPTELEMRVYHRLIHIRDQKERHEDIPNHITSHPVFQLTTDFRLHVQQKSEPISKTSALVVDEEGMEIFGKLANVLHEQGNIVMIYLVACILERHFGKDAIEDIEALRGDLGISDIIDGVSFVKDDKLMDDEMLEDMVEHHAQPIASTFDHPPAAVPPSIPAPKPVSAFSTLATTPNVFNTLSPFGGSVSSTLGTTTPTSTFGITKPSTTEDANPPVPASRPESNGFSQPLLVPSGTNSFIPLASTPFSSPFISPFTSASVTSSFPSSSSAGQPIQLTALPPHTPSSNPLSASPFDGNPSNTAERKNATGSTLNPKAPIFMSKAVVAPSSLEAFQRSLSPSPSSVPLTTEVPPTPEPAPSSSSSSSLPSLPSKKPTPPPRLSQRTSATPPLPKINTNPSTNSVQNIQPPTPSDPPLLPKPQTIPLPLTPTLHAPPSNPLLGFLKNTINTSLPPIGNDVLSPLYLPSPTTSGQSIIHNFSPAKSTSKFKSERFNGLLNGKGKTPIRTLISNDDVDDHATSEELQAKALAFARKSVLVKEHFDRWQKRTTDRAAWVEACKQSDAYRQKIQERRSLTPQLGEKRRISTSSSLSGSILKKRARRRISSDYRPRQTDEELAQRFKENHEEHERRWTQGSFLQTINAHIKTKLGGNSLNPAWRIWLSMNPESDATAIWLERKLDVPASGQWTSETVFSISPTKGLTAPNFPGILIFECTPLEGVVDDIERKYHILDDCSRLRDIIKSFPSSRYFIPSLLVLQWTEGEQPKPPSDIVEMIEKLVEQSSIQSYHVFSITSVTKNLDEKFSEALELLSLDLEGKLVRYLTIHDTFKLFESSFTSFISEWIQECSVDGHFDWSLFGHIVQVAVTVLNGISRSVLDLIGIEGKEPFPIFKKDEIKDSSSAYKYVAIWLPNTDFGENADKVALNLQSHKNIGRDFPAREFLEQLWDLVEVQIGVFVKQGSGAKFYIPVAKINSSLDSYRLAFQPHKESLGQALNMSIRRSPKRRSVSVNTEPASLQNPKRRRLSSSAGANSESPSPTTSPYLNGLDVPSPTNTTASLAPLEAPVVTVAMLRALTRDIRKKYVAS